MEVSPFNCVNIPDFAMQKTLEYQKYGLAKERNLLQKQIAKRFLFQVEKRKEVRITQEYFSTEVLMFHFLFVSHIVDL